MKKTLLTISVLLLLSQCLLFSQAVVDQLVGYWSFNGNANDQISNNNGVVSGATLTADKNGNSGMAYYFDGADNISVPYNTILDMGTEDMSVSLWIKAETTQSTTIPALLYHGAGAADNPGYWLKTVQSTGQVNYTLGNGIKRISGYSTSGIYDNAWHHVVYTFDRDGLAKIYIDGQNNTLGAGYDISEFNNNNIIRNYPIIFGYTNYFKGCLDEIMIFKKALSESEILQLYNYYSLTVTSGTGSGYYEPGQSVTITASSAPAGYTFDRWTGDLSYLADQFAQATTVTVPSQNISFTATYKAVTSPWTETEDMISFPGQVAIGTATVPEGYTLAVDGKIIAKEVKVTLDGWSDFVFAPGYPLMPIHQLESYIIKYNHLPSVPSEADVTENGVSLGDINAILLQKVEELTLYIIDQQKQIDELKRQIKEKK